MERAEQIRDVSGWWLDERTSVGRENLDPEHVARYDDKEDAAAGAEIKLLQAQGIGPTSVVVDLGAGTGQFALPAAETFGPTYAVDPSPVMLQRLRATVATRNSSLQVIEGGFLSYVHQGPQPDVLYSRWALHHLPDFWKSLALARARAMLQPGALFRLSDVVFSFDPAQAPERIEAWCATIGDDPTEWTRADAEEHIRDEHSTYSWLLEPMIERAGFEIAQADYGADGFRADYLLRAA